MVGLELAKELVRAFVEAKFDGAERHRRRLERSAYWRCVMAIRQQI